MTPFKQRILDALANGPLMRRVLMYRIYPPDKFPRAWRNPTRGGPPGCVMTFGRALGQLDRAGAISVFHGSIGQEDIISIHRDWPTWTKEVPNA